jgi:hypothetical protein
MNLQKLILTKNACYIAGEKIKPKGIMLHSTGANNPKLSRYVGPNDGKLGENKYGNHWNAFHPGGDNIGPHTYVNKNGAGKCDVCGGRQVCVHGFIGKLADGSIATYQTLPWDYRGWHCAGTGNDTHIGIEICEDGLTDVAYFKKVYQEAVEVCAYLCKQYGFTEKDILCHSEAGKKGIASNHSDVMHWFPKHGKSMDTLRADVKAMLSKKETAPSAPSASVAVDGINVGRGTNQLILYVGKESTGTNKWGAEVILNPDLTVASVGKYGVGNTTIPKGKLALSGHDSKAYWLLENLKVGAKIKITVNA